MLSGRVWSGTRFCVCGILWSVRGNGRALGLWCISAGATAGPALMLLQFQPPQVAFVNPVNVELPPVQLLYGFRMISYQ